MSGVAPTCTGSTSECISYVETVFSTGHIDPSDKYSDGQKCTSSLVFVCMFYTKHPQVITMTTIVTVTPTVEDTPSLMNPPTLA